ncbi:hypothetical protein D9615_004333 [Tricholomella constricta]|uniref:Uncharacterized protein n=1 Tax=Tricholomella constricta TaxID=117010 RepID=A0A8H5M624_9AGAR|nr:hypothetical protein D9615_004333 [Tricholomella constricta]
MYIQPTLHASHNLRITQHFFGMSNAVSVTFSADLQLTVSRLRASSLRNHTRDGFDNMIKYHRGTTYVLEVLLRPSSSRAPITCTIPSTGLMYNNGYGAPEITNNPFINDPRNPQSRFPDLSTMSDSQTQWLQPPSNANPAGYHQGTYQQPLYQQQSQLSPDYAQPTRLMSPGFSPGIAPQPTGIPFQPTSAFGQQLAANISGTSYGYLQGQAGQQHPQQQYHPVQQQLQSPTYVAQFDPYASIGQGWNGEAQPHNQMQNTTAGGGPVSTSASSSGNPHPREYLRTHKAEIEAWDTYAWKQLLNAFDALKESWEGRTKELGGKISQLQSQLQYGGGGYYIGQIQQEGLRLQGLLKDAQSQFDSVAASSFQMREVFEGYRQSSDHASKRRVREASNAAFQGLPDWPPQVY